MTSTREEKSDIKDVGAHVILGCQSGDRAAQRTLYELTHERVYQLMVRMAGSEAALDLMQQVFLQVFRKIEQFAGNSRFETWLYRVAVNEALQYQRKEQRWKHQPLTNEPMSDDEISEERDRKEVLELALARIAPELRAIFVLREVEGLSYREIAVTLDIPEGTVGSRLNRARRDLQQQLADLGWEG